MKPVTIIEAASAAGVLREGPAGSAWSYSGSGVGSGGRSFDGSYSGANVNPSHTEHKGVWMRVGDRKFVFTFMFFTRDDKGVFNGIVKARGTVTLAEDLKSYDSQVERVIMDTAGNVLSTTPGIKGHSVRMELELQRSPQ
jgi:hypothetical protein